MIGRARFRLVLLLAVALILGACGNPAGGETATTGQDTTTAGEDTTPTMSSTEATDAPATTAASEPSEPPGTAYKIGFLLPETAVVRYETKDRPFFEAKLAEICPDCELLYANANSDPAEQARQADTMLAEGVDVLVVDPYDGVAAASIVEAASAQGVPVIAYDRLIQSPDLTYVISNDYYQVGVLQGETLVAALNDAGVDPASGGILMMNGATTDNNAGNIKAGALSVIEASGYQILESIDTWDPAEAQQWVASQILVFGDQIKAIYSANDANAGGALAALRAAGVQEIPPMTGLDADIAALQRILVGEQLMTTYNAFRTEAETAAEVAYSVAQGEIPETDAEVEGIPAALNPPVAVTIDNIGDTVIADEFYTVDEICTADYADACAEAGLL